MFSVSAAGVGRSRKIRMLWSWKMMCDEQGHRCALEKVDGVVRSGLKRRIWLMEFHDFTAQIQDSMTMFRCDKNVIFCSLKSILIVNKCDKD